MTSVNDKKPQNPYGNYTDFADGFPDTAELITVIEATDPNRVCKVYTLDANGDVQKEAKAFVKGGNAHTVRVASAADMVEVLKSVTASPNKVIVPGAWSGCAEGDEFKIVTRTAIAAALGRETDLHGVHSINGKMTAARLGLGIDNSQWLLFDADSPDGMPDGMAAMTVEQRLIAFENILPGISSCERIEVRSSSARIDSGEGPGLASHAWIRISDPSKIALLRTVVRVKMVTTGLFFIYTRRSTKDRSVVVGAEPRTLFDLAVWHPGRIVFCAEPECHIDGYTVADAGITIVNEGAGSYDVSGLTMPEPHEIKAAGRLLGHRIRVKVKDDAITYEAADILSWETPIESQGEIKTLRQWVEGMRRGEKLRCEAPFRESQSEAAFIRYPKHGDPFVYDTGAGVKYVLSLEGQRKRADTPPMVAKAIYAIAKVLDISESDLAFEIDLDYDVIQSMVNASGFDQGKGKWLALAADGNIRFFTKGSADMGYIETFGAPLDRRGLRSLLESQAQKGGLNVTQTTAFMRQFDGSILRSTLAHIECNRQFISLALETDMFIKRAYVNIKDTVAHLIFPHAPFAVAPIDHEIVDDYKSHWPQIDEFIDLVAASRFAVARKKAFLWLRADSDWGKGLLIGALGELGILVDLNPVQVETATEGKPVGLQIHQFRNCWILGFNEFKSAKSELKGLEQTIDFAPKNLPSCSAQVYLKLFLSAEAVESLASDESGVDDQFANRFSLIQTKGKIEQRPLLMKSRGRYFAGVKNYIAHRLNARVAGYRALGRAGAGDTGDDFVIDFHKKYGIGNSFRRISESLEDHAKNFCAWVVDNFASGRAKDSYMVNHSERAVLSRAHVVAHDDKSFGLYVTSPKQLFDVWFKETFNPSAAGKLIFRKEDIKKLLPEDKVKKIGGKVFRVAYIATVEGEGFEMPQFEEVG